MAVNKRKRTKKVSKGIHGATKHPLSEIAKALLGKGLVRSTRHVPVAKSWQGTFVVSHPFDPEQAAAYEAELKRKRGGDV